MKKSYVFMLIVFVLSIFVGVIFFVDLSLGLPTNCSDCAGQACCQVGSNVCCGECCWAMPGGCISGPCPHIML